MRYDASEDQQLLRDTTRRFLEARSPVSEVRRLMEDRVGFDGPFLPTNVVAFAVAEGGTEAQRQRVLPALAGGELVATWCFAGTGLSPGTRPVGVRATTAGHGFVLTG